MNSQLRDQAPSPRLDSTLSTESASDSFSPSLSLFLCPSLLTLMGSLSLSLSNKQIHKLFKKKKEGEAFQLLRLRDKTTPGRGVGICKHL